MLFFLKHVLPTFLKCNFDTCSITWFCSRKGRETGLLPSIQSRWLNRTTGQSEGKRIYLILGGAVPLTLFTNKRVASCRHRVCVCVWVSLYLQTDWRCPMLVASVSLRDSEGHESYNQTKLIKRSEHACTRVRITVCVHNPGQQITSPPRHRCKQLKREREVRAPPIEMCPGRAD